MQASTKPGMEGVQETAGKIAVERKLQDEVGFCKEDQFEISIRLK